MSADLGFVAFLAVGVALITAAAFFIIDLMPFPPLLIWSAKMIVVLVSGLSILLGFQVGPG